MTAEQPLVAAVVPVFNRLKTTSDFVASFRDLHYQNKVLVVCDDGSTDGTADFLRCQTDVVTVTGDGTLWWSGGTNAAIKKALELNPDYILTVNDDSLLAPDYLNRLVTEAMRFPCSIMASSLVQLQNPDRHWSLGASYLNYGHVLYVNDCFGARTSHIAALLEPSFCVDTTPGNGVLYPAEVFQIAGLFDETWTPQYHGDTLMVHRAAKVGYGARLCLNAVIMNDMSHHDDVKKFDPLLSKKSALYAPAVYKSVEERDGQEAALDHLLGLAAQAGGGLCPECAKEVKRSGLTGGHAGGFEFDPHIAHSVSAGAFALLGYERSHGVVVRRCAEGHHFDYTFLGRGILNLVLRVRRNCTVYCFAITPTRPDHLDLVFEGASRGSQELGSEWVTWFQVPVMSSDALSLPLALEFGCAMQCTFVLAHSDGVAVNFRRELKA